MSDPATTTTIEKPPIFNRGRLLKIAAIAIAAIAVTGILLSSIVSSKKTGEEQAKPVADVKAPDFSSYRLRAEKNSSSSPAERTSPSGVPSAPILYQEAPPPDAVPYSPPSSSQAERSPLARDGYSGGTGRSGRQKSSLELARESSLVPEVQGIFMGAGQKSAPSGSSGQNRQQGTLSSDSSIPLPAYPDFSGLSGALRGNENSYNAQNMQGDKKSFYSSGSLGGKDINTGRFLEVNTVWNGTIIPGVLITGINTDLPGDVQARVTQNIYDSLTGKNLLVPQGSVLLAKYNSSISFAQSRVQIVWNTLIRPDGFELELGSMNAVDAEGFSGIEGEYHENLFQYAKAAGIISLFTILNGKINDSISSSNSIRYQEMAAANQNVVNQLGTSIINRALDIQPTITVDNGTEIKVMLNKNIMLPPVEDHPVVSQYIRR